MFINHKLYIEPIDAYIDPIWPAKIAIITHGHADHARGGHERVIATPQTIDIMKRRYGEECAKSFTPLLYGEELTLNDVTLSFHPAGHILGSAQALLQYQGKRVVMTGDYKTRPDSTAAPFELVKCDLFITEATFGLPVFRHPDPKSEIRKLLKSLEDNPERSHVIGAYALGKAQRIIKMIREEGYERPIFLHGAQEKLCNYYIEQGINLGQLEKALVAKKEDMKGHIVVAPPSALKGQWSRRLPDPVICYASGWMTVKQRAKQSLVELPLVISDHADWDELTSTILGTEASEVWVTHGREDALVHWCRSKGLKAELLSLQGNEEEE